MEAVREADADHIQATSWDEVVALVCHKPVNVLVLDPYADRANRADDIVALLRQFPSTPVIVYTEFTPPALRALMLLAQYGLQETLLFQVDDDSRRLSRLLIRLGTLPLVLRLLHEIRHEREQLVPSLGCAVDDLFRRPHAYTSASDLVIVGRTPLTSLYRALMEAGFAPPKQLFMAARVLHATVYARDSGTTIQQVAEKTGYQYPRVLTQHTLAIFGCRPTGLRDLSDDDALPPLLRWTKLGREAHDQTVVAEESGVVMVWGALFGYGRSLEAVNRWSAAAFLYQSIAVTLGSPDECLDPWLSATALIRYAVMMRNLGRFDRSHRLYHWAQLFATRVNAQELLLRSRIGIANTLLAQGNLGDAEAIVSEVVGEASKAGLITEEALARHGRASIRTLRKRHADALADFFEAYQLTTDPTDRDLLLVDLAGCAGDAGYRRLARDVFHMLLKTTKVPIAQSVALGTLIEFAAFEGDAEEFESLRRQSQLHMQTYTAPVNHVMHIALYTAYGIERFETRDAAIEAYHAVIAQANTIGSHQIAYQAQERLTALLEGAAPLAIPPSQEAPAQLRDLLSSLISTDKVASVP